VLNLAERYPSTTFTVVDGLVPPLYPNVQSVTFKDHEGAFLIGMIAGKMSRSDFVGFVGGMDAPLIRNFAAGFRQGVRYTNPDAKIDVQYLGMTSDAWSNPDKAHSIAMMQYREGVDVIFAAAGGSTVGALRAADDANKLAIGVDSNQNGLYPGRVLTSLIKRVDLAVYETLKNSHEGTWSAGIKSLGIKEGALDYAVDQNNRALISEKLIEQVATAKDSIIAGKLTVEGYVAR
jgi:basic membrane protein A